MRSRAWETRWALSGGRGVGRGDARAGESMPETESTCVWPPAQVPLPPRRVAVALKASPGVDSGEGSRWARGRRGSGGGEASPWLPGSQRRLLPPPGPGLQRDRAVGLSSRGAQSTLHSGPRGVRCLAVARCVFMLRFPLFTCSWIVCFTSSRKLCFSTGMCL